MPDEDGEEFTFPHDNEIDSRELHDLLDDLRNRYADGWANLDKDERQLLAELEPVSDTADWQYGAVLVADDHFEDYARELAESIGAINGEESWPYTYIDWEAAASALQQDYTPYEIDGTTYWVR